MIRRQFDSSQDHQRNGVGLVGLPDLESGLIIRKRFGFLDDLFHFVQTSRRGSSLGRGCHGRQQSPADFRHTGKGSGGRSGGHRRDRQGRFRWGRGRGRWRGGGLCPQPAGGSPKKNSEKQLTAFRDRRGRMQWMHVFLHSHEWIGMSKSGM